MNIFRKYNLIFKTTFFSILVFLGSFKISYAFPYQDDILSFIGNAMLWISSQILALAGIIFNFTLQYTLNFKALVGSTGVVNIGWTIIRDMSNMVFIFILLFIAIGTILGLSGHNAKNLLKNVILAALFINFSLFITNVIIDASNVMAIGFYNATISGVSGTGSNYASNNGGLSKYDKGISDIFAQSLNLKSIYDGKDITPGKDGEMPIIKHKNIFTIGLFGSLLMLITAFVFFAAAILFIIRTVVLMFLMMISPIAFIGSILPETRSMAKKWWSELFNQAFFAPIYLMFIYIVARGITSPAFQKTLSMSGNEKGFAEAFTGGGALPGAVVVIFNFLLIIGLLLGALISAKSMGATGASGVISMGKGMQKWGQGVVGGATFGATGRLGRNIIGGLAYKGATAFEKKDMATSWGGKMLLKGLRGTADSSFDARNTTLGKAAAGAVPGGLGEGIKGGYTTKTKEKRKAEIKYAQSLEGDSGVQKKDASGNLMYGKDANGNDDLTKPIMATRTELRGENLKKRSVWSTITGTTGGNQAAGKALTDLVTHKKDLKKEKKDLKVLTDDLVDERKKPSPDPTEVARLRTEISDKEDVIEKLNEKIKKINDSLKDAKK